MNETNELFCEIGASDAVALANAKGWDDEILAAELGSGILAAIGCIFWRHRRQRDEERAARRHYDFVCEVRALEGK